MKTHPPSPFPVTEVQFRLERKKRGKLIRPDLVLYTLFFIGSGNKGQGIEGKVKVASAALFIVGKKKSTLPITVRAAAKPGQCCFPFSVVVALDWRAAEGTKREKDENGRRAPGPKQKRKRKGKGKLLRLHRENETL